MTNLFPQTIWIMSPCHTKAAACVYIDIPLVTAMQGFAEDTTPPLKNAGSQQQTKAMPCITLALGHSKQFCTGTPHMNSMKLVIPLHFIPLKKTPNDAVTPQR